MSNEIDIPEARAEQFKLEVTEATGQRIDLEYKSRADEDMFLTVRRGNVSFWKDVDQLVIVDLFADTPEGQAPVGYYDWEIRKNVALGNKCRHGHLPNVILGHDLANKEWSGEGVKVSGTTFLNYGLKNGFEGMNQLRQRGIVTNEDMWSEPIYQNQGLGSLLVVTSSIALSSSGVEYIAYKDRNKAADALWNRFGWSEEKEYPVASVLEHPRSKEIIQRFF